MDEVLQIVFDCDGVLLQSANIKTVAFGKTVAPFGELAAEQFIAYHNKNFGISRMTKFKWFCEEVLKDNNPALQEKLASDFAKNVQQEILICPFIDGVEEALTTLYGKMPLYVCSGTPHDELVDILTKRGIAKYFTGIYGTPPEKNILLKNLVEESGIPAKNTLMVGDMQTDLDAANYVGTQFLGIGEYFVNKNVSFLNDMKDIVMTISKV